MPSALETALDNTLLQLSVLNPPDVHLISSELSKIPSSVSGKQVIAAADRTKTLPHLIRLLACEDAVVAEQLLSLLRNYTNAATPIKARAFEAGIVRSIIPWLRHPVPKVMVALHAALGVFFLHNPQFSKELMDCGAGQELVNLLGHSDAVVARCAASLLRNAGTSGPAFKTFMVVHGALPRLVVLLDSKVADVREAAGGALREIAEGRESEKAALISSNAVPGLVRLLNELPKHARVASAALQFLCHDYKPAVPVLVRAGAVPGLVKAAQVTSDSPMLRAAAAALCTIVLSSSSNAEVVARADGAKALRVAQHSGFDKKEMKQALTELKSHDRSQPAAPESVASTGSSKRGAKASSSMSLASAVATLQEGNVPDPASVLAVVLPNASCASATAVKLLSSAGVIASLNELLAGSSCAAVASMAVSTIASIALFGDEQRQLILNSEWLAIVNKLFRGSSLHYTVQTGIVCAVACIAAGNDRCKSAIVDCGILKPICTRPLASDVSGPVIQTLRALFIVASGTREHRDAVFAAATPKRLVNLVSKYNTSSAEPAINLVWLLAGASAEHRAELENAGVVQELKNATKASQAPTKTAALNALSVLS